MILICSTDNWALIRVLSRLTIPNRQENKKKEGLCLINVRSKEAWIKVEIVQLQISLFLAGTSGIDFAEHDFLQFVIERQHTSTSHTTKNIGTSTFEQRLNTFLANDL